MGKILEKLTKGKEENSIKCRVKNISHENRSDRIRTIRLHPNDQKRTIRSQSNDQIETKRSDKNRTIKSRPSAITYPVYSLKCWPMVTTARTRTGDPRYNAVARSRSPRSFVV